MSHTVEALADKMMRAVNAAIEEARPHLTNEEIAQAVYRTLYASNARDNEEADANEWEGLETTKTEGALGWATFELIFAHLSANLPEGLTLRRDEDGVGWAEATTGSTPGMLAYAFWVRPVEDDAEHGPNYSTVHLACRLPEVWYYEAGYDPKREGGAAEDHADVYAHMVELARIALS